MYAHELADKLHESGTGEDKLTLMRALPKTATAQQGLEAMKTQTNVGKITIGKAEQIIAGTFKAPSTVVTTTVTTPGSEAPPVSLAPPAQIQRPAVHEPVTSRHDDDNDTDADADINASKAAISMAEEKNIDLRTITGTGAGGQITKTDVQSAVDAMSSPGIR